MNSQEITLATIGTIELPDHALVEAELLDNLEQRMNTASETIMGFVRLILRPVLQKKGNEEIMAPCGFLSIEGIASFRTAEECEQRLREMSVDALEKVAAIIPRP